MDKNESRITHLSNAYTDEKLRQENFYKRKRIIARRRLTAISAIGFFILAILAIPILNMRNDRSELAEKLSAKEEELSDLEDKQEELNYQINLLKDEDYVAKLARSEYYVTKDNEIVFSFPGDETPSYQEATEDAEATDK